MADIKDVLDSAIYHYGARGGEVKDKKRRDGRPAFGHKTDFCYIQQPSDTLSDGLCVLHHTLEYRHDQQNLHMSPTSRDAHILQWARNVGDIEDHRLRAEFYHIQHELAQIIMKEVLKKQGCSMRKGKCRGKTSEHA